MTEEFLHYVWKYRLFDNSGLITSEGEPVEIIKTGEHNFNSGPDFFNAKVKIGETVWAGNVEIHINASDWKKHLHQEDKAYNNVILHVVFNLDQLIERTNGEIIPAIELKETIDRNLFSKYSSFKLSKDWIACENQIAEISPLVIQNWIDRLLVERLESKSNEILYRLKQNNNNWEETFYQLLAKNFGFKINAEPFELLARSLPQQLLSKMKDNPLQIEAVVFGQSGMLDKTFEDNYPRLLQNEYSFLKHKFRLSPVDSHVWKFLRLRPMNFPTIRLSQFSSLIQKSSHLFSKVLDVENTEQIKLLFDVSASEYWNTHYTFDQPSVNNIKSLGESAIENIIINTIVPILFVYGKHKKNELYVERALALLEALKAEDNSIIKKWKEIKVSVKTAHSSQALLQLKNNYCNFKRCLHCSIGTNLLKKK